MNEAKRQATPELPGASPGTARRIALPVLTGIGWAWSVSLLWFRIHWILSYLVQADTPAWKALVFSPLGGPAWLVALLAAGGVLAGWGCRRLVSGGRLRWAGLCTAGLFVIPMLEALRGAVPALPRTFLEPLGLALLTGLAFTLPAGQRQPGSEARGPGRWARLASAGAVVLAAAGLGVWWFAQSRQAYADYLLGYFDFGHFARRVINTWAGRGFLMQMPHLPAFWDHFNPGLALLVPLWAAWPKAEMFFALQAACLAAPAAMVYAIARRLGGGRAAAAAWAGAYLCYPVVGQLNLNYSYGWHPVSVAIPLLFAAAWAMAAGKKWAALLLAVAACAFQEDVFVTVAGLCAGLGVLARIRAGRRGAGPAPEGCGDPISSCLRPRTWLLAAGCFLVAMIAITASMDFTRYQVGRFAHLGGNALEVLVSPVARPEAFWGEVFSRRSGYFLLAMLAPLGLGSLLRGWPVMLALAVPMGVLLAWKAAGAKCIAFQYTSTLVVVLVLAALVGSARGGAGRVGGAPAGLARGAAGALAASLTLSLFIGALPPSQRTMEFVVPAEDRAERDRHVAALNAAVALCNGPERSVVASGRAAAHLLKVRRLEPVSDFFLHLPPRAGDGETAAALTEFDRVLLDSQEVFQQSAAQMERLEESLEAAGFALVFDRDGIRVYARGRPAGEPGSGGEVRAVTD